MDDTDIQRLADLILADPLLAEAEAEDRAKIGYDLGLYHGMKAGLTDTGSKEVAALVKRRIEWTLFANRNKPASNQT